MAITATKVRKMKSQARPKAPNKRETFLRTNQVIADIQIDSAGRWPHGRAIGRATYDFAVDGGATSTITPSAGVVIPANAIVTEAWIDVIASVTSAGAGTVAVQLVNAGDILGTTAKTSLSAGTVLVGVPNGNDTTAPAPLKIASDATLQVVIATAALTAGKINIYIEYIYPNV
jgi:hypothetical protein